METEIFLGFRQIKAISDYQFGKEITNTDEDITAIIEEELEMLKLAGLSG